MELLIHTSLLSKPSFCPSSYPNFAFTGDVPRRRRYFPRNPTHRTSIPLRISLSSQQNLISNANPSQEFGADFENLSGGESNFKSIEVIGIGSRKNAVIDFCLEYPFQSSTSLRFWSLQLKESGEVQLLQKSREQDSVLRNIEVPVSQLSSSQAVVLFGIKARLHMATRSGRRFRGRLTDNQRDEILFRIMEHLNGMQLRLSEMESRIRQNKDEKIKNSFDNGTNNCDDVEEDEVDTSLLSVVRRIHTSPKAEEEDLQHTTIFQKLVRCGDQARKLIIDSGSCKNVVSTSTVERLKLPVQPHPQPYKVAWIDNTFISVASAGYGVDHVTAIELLRAIKSANGLAIGIILKPFNFEGQRRQDEVNDLVNKLWEHTKFCIVVDTDVLLKREVVTLAEALRSANNAVLLAMNAISILMSDIHTKFLDQSNSKVKELKVLEVAELLESYKRAKVGFGAGNNMKSSIARAVFDCPFLDEGIKDNSMVVCTVTSGNVINNNDMHDCLQTFRRTTGFKKDIVISVVHEPNMEPNLIVTTLITLGCNEQVMSQKQGFLSSLALRFPFVFSLLGRDHPDKDTLPVHSYENTLGVITSSCGVDMPNLDSADGGDESLDPFSGELETPLGSNYDEISNFREFTDNDKRKNDETLKRGTDHLSNTNDRTSEEQPAFQRESRNVGPGFHIAQEWAKERAISGAAPVLEKQCFFALPVGVKPFGQSTDSLSITPPPTEPRVLDGINGVSQDTPDMLSWDGLTDAGVEAVMDVYNAASTLLKGKNAAIPRKEGVLSARAASMLEAERDSEKKWSPTTEMQYRGGIYKGRCQGGLPEGKGCLTLPNGSIYDGMWRYGKRSGLGTFYYSNGDVFQGSWRDDLMHGRGWFYFHTGDRWFVNFWKGKPNGEGRFYSEGGEIFFGSFQDGWRHGQSLFIDVEGSRWAEIWDEGVLVSREQLDSELSAE